GSRLLPCARRRSRHTRCRVAAGAACESGWRRADRRWARRQRGRYAFGFLAFLLSFGVKKGSGTFVRSTLRAVPAKVPDPFLTAVNLWEEPPAAPEIAPAAPWARPPCGSPGREAPRAPRSRWGRAGGCRACTGPSPS